jgi:hypothetical protein
VHTFGTEAAAGVETRSPAAAAKTVARKNGRTVRKCILCWIEERR